MTMNDIIGYLLREYMILDLGVLELRALMILAEIVLFLYVFSVSNRRLFRHLPAGSLGFYNSHLPFSHVRLRIKNVDWYKAHIAQIIEQGTHAHHKTEKAGTNEYETQD